MNLSLLSMSVLSGDAQASGGPSMLMMIVYVVIIFGAMYFFAIRPQKKEQKRLQTMISQMEVGDVVVTTSGFYGIVISVSDEDCIVEFGNNKNCRIPMRKSAISEIEKASDSVAVSAPAEQQSGAGEQTSGKKKTVKGPRAAAREAREAQKEAQKAAKEKAIEENKAAREAQAEKKD